MAHWPRNVPQIERQFRVRSDDIANLVYTLWIDRLLPAIAVIASVILLQKGGRLMFNFVKLAFGR